MPMDRVRWTVGSVPYLNGKPMVWSFERRGEESPVRVLYDVPSRLPELLRSGKAQAIMVSSIRALATPGARVAGGTAVTTRGAVQSVRLFSKVPPERIRSLALDLSSMTSNALAQVLLHDEFGLRPETEPCPPDLRAMLERHDACVMIGDAGMAADGAGLTVLDLGAWWRKRFHAPFVWAVWLGGDDLSPELARELSASVVRDRAGLSDIARDVAPKIGVPERVCLDYLTKTMHYRFGPEQWRGMARFGQALTELGILKEWHFPAVISP